MIPPFTFKVLRRSLLLVAAMSSALSCVKQIGEPERVPLADLSVRLIVPKAAISRGTEGASDAERRIDYIYLRFYYKNPSAVGTAPGWQLLSEHKYAISTEAPPGYSRPESITPSPDGDKYTLEVKGLKVTEPALDSGDVQLMAIIMANAEAPRAAVTSESEFWHTVDGVSRVQPMLFAGAGIFSRPSEGERYSANFAMTRQLSKLRVRVRVPSYAVPSTLEIEKESLEIYVKGLVGDSYHMPETELADLGTDPMFPTVPKYASFSRTAKMSDGTLRMQPGAPDTWSQELVTVDSMYMHSHDELTQTTVTIRMVVRDPVTGVRRTIWKEYDLNHITDWNQDDPSQWPSMVGVPALERNTIYTLEVDVVSMSEAVGTLFPGVSDWEQGGDWSLEID